MNIEKEWVHLTGTQRSIKTLEYKLNIDWFKQEVSKVFDQKG